MKLQELVIRNYKCFGPQGCRVRIDDIVVLVGPNNVGKSSVLDAYEDFARAGAALDADKFPRDERMRPVEIEGLFVDVTDSDQETIGKVSCFIDETFGRCIRVKYVWSAPGEKGKKFTWDAELKDWREGGTGGFDSLLASRVPQPHRVRPTDGYAVVESVIRELLVSAIKAQVKKDGSKVQPLLDELAKVNRELSDAVRKEVDVACAAVGERLGKVIPGTSVHLEPQIGKFEPEKLLGVGSELMVGLPGREREMLAQQGTGIQRAFLWSAMAALAGQGLLKKEKGKSKKEESEAASHILLIDEPEVFLHPPLARAAKRALYELAASEDWQVMATTHSPYFVDVSEPHTTIVRIDADAVGGSRAFSTDSADFSSDDRDRFQMVRYCNPAVTEFFFADRVVLVEGDTEHVVLSAALRDSGDPALSGVCIINCGSKGAIPTFAKILKHFGVPFVAVHDVDHPKVLNSKSQKWDTNAAWKWNLGIAQIVEEESGKGCLGIAHFPDFEGHLLGSAGPGKDKPYRALKAYRAAVATGDDRAAAFRSLLESTLAGQLEGVYRSRTELAAYVSGKIAKSGFQSESGWQIDADDALMTCMEGGE